MPIGTVDVTRQGNRTGKRYTFTINAKASSLIDSFNSITINWFIYEYHEYDIDIYDWFPVSWFVRGARQAGNNWHDMHDIAVKSKIELLNDIIINMMILD